jgi:hypothetical protein
MIARSITKSAGSTTQRPISLSLVILGTVRLRFVRHARDEDPGDHGAAKTSINCRSCEDECIKLPTKRSQTQNDVHDRPTKENGNLPLRDRSNARRPSSPWQNYEKCASGDEVCGTGKMVPSAGESGD